MIIYFHIDELNRDSIVASALKLKFKSNGDILIYGNRLVSRLIKIFHSFFFLVKCKEGQITFEESYK